MFMLIDEFRYKAHEGFCVSGGYSKFCAMSSVNLKMIVSGLRGASSVGLTILSVGDINFGLNVNVCLEKNGFDPS